MATEDREIVVDTRYPIPAFVEGITYVAPSEEILDEDWSEVEETSPYLTLNDVDQTTEITQTPTPLSVIDQEISYPKGGSGVVNAVLLIDEVPYVTDYEIRVVPR